MRTKTFWKAVTAILLFTALGYGIVVFSMYWWPDMPRAPRPSEGRIYALNNHGTYTYMNRKEYWLFTAAPLVTLPLLAAIAAIHHFIDPFDYKRKRRMYGLRPPRDFR